MTLHSHLTSLLLVSGNKFDVIPPSNGSITIKERGHKAIIIGLPLESLAVKFPPKQDGFFNAPYTKNCDYALFVRDGTNIEVFLCELKKSLGAGAQETGLEQIKCGKPLLQYIISALQTHFNINGSIAYYYLLISQKEHPSLQSKPSPYVEQISENMLGYCGIKVKKLIGETFPLSRCR